MIEYAIVHYAADIATAPHGTVIRDEGGRVFVWLEDFDRYGWYSPGEEGSEAAAYFTYPVAILYRGSSPTEPAETAAAFPRWTGTNASARMIADRVRKIDEWAEVDTDETPGYTTPVLILDTVPNRITLQPGQRPVFDGERWSVEKAPEETTS